MSGRGRTNWIVLAMLVIASLTILMPMYLTVVTALKSPQDMTGSVWSLPTTWHWENIPEAIRMTSFWRAFRNSALVAVPTVVATILMNSIIGYVIARNLSKRLFRFSYLYIMSGMFVPFAIMMLPLVKFMSNLGLNNIAGLVILYVIYNLPLNMLIYTGYVHSIPRDLEESGAMDGAGPWRSYWTLIFPLMTPVHATVGILTGLAAWNDFLLPLVILTNPSTHTLPLVQYVFQSQFTTNYNLAFSSYLLAILPMVIVYLIFQRSIIGGVMAGSIKA